MFFYLLGFMQPAKMKQDAVFDVQDTAGHLFPLKLLMPVEEAILGDIVRILSTHLNNHILFLHAGNNKSFPSLTQFVSC